MLVAPGVVSHNRKPVARQVKAVSTVPGGIKRELNATSTGWPASRLERQTALNIPRLRGWRGLWIIAALETKSILVWGALPRCCTDRYEDVGPLYGKEPPAAPIHSTLERPRLNM